MKKLLICYFDETLVNIITELEFVRFLIRQKKFRFRQYILSIFSIPINIIPLLLNKGTWLKAWPACRSLQEQKLLFEQFSTKILKNISLNNDVLEIVNNFNGRKILVTGCYDLLANHMLEDLNVQGVFDEIYGTEMGVLNFFVKRHPY